MATVREIAGYLEERVPSSLKLDFDNVGLLCGFPEREVSRVLVVLISRSRPSRRHCRFMRS